MSRHLHRPSSRVMTKSLAKHESMREEGARQPRAALHERGGRTRTEQARRSSRRRRGPRPCERAGEVRRGLRLEAVARETRGAYASCCDDCARAFVDQEFSKQVERIQRGLANFRELMQRSESRQCTRKRCPGGNLPEFRTPLCACT